MGVMQSDRFVHAVERLIKGNQGLGAQYGQSAFRRQDLPELTERGKCHDGVAEPVRGTDKQSVFPFPDGDGFFPERAGNLKIREKRSVPFKHFFKKSVYLCNAV